MIALFQDHPRTKHIYGDFCSAFPGIPSFSSRMKNAAVSYKHNITARVTQTSWWNNLRKWIVLLLRVCYFHFFSFCSLNRYDCASCLFFFCGAFFPAIEIIHFAAFSVYILHSCLILLSKYSLGFFFFTDFYILFCCCRNASFKYYLPKHSYLEIFLSRYEHSRINTLQWM